MTTANDITSFFHVLTISFVSSGSVLLISYRNCVSGGSGVTDINFKGCKNVLVNDRLDLSIRPCRGNKSNT